MYIIIEKYKPFQLIYACVCKNPYANKLENDLEVNRV